MTILLRSIMAHAVEYNSGRLQPRQVIVTVSMMEEEGQVNKMIQGPT